ncbi:hypothetical protein AOQ84DRAFT_360531, partial [Glonium stellatum]
VGPAAGQAGQAATATTTGTTPTPGAGTGASVSSVSSAGASASAAGTGAVDPSRERERERDREKEKEATAKESRVVKASVGVGDPFHPIPAHKSVVVGKVTFAMRQISWSRGGEWAVAVGDQGMICLFRRWEDGVGGGAS